MQCHINSLAVEAGLIDPRDDWETLPHDYRDALTAFAQAVARECLTIVDPKGEHRARPNDYIGGDDGVALLDAVSDEIRARFGLEE